MYISPFVTVVFLDLLATLASMPTIACKCIPD